jgi:hypothetical protein
MLYPRFFRIIVKVKLVKINILTRGENLWSRQE